MHRRYTATYLSRLPPSWSFRDTTWMLSLYGTAIGAGVLFLPIGIGLSGFWLIFLNFLIIYPIVFYSHRGLSRVVLSSSRSDGNLISAIREYCGAKFARIVVFFYFFSIYPIVLLYSVAITNTVESFLINQLHVTPPSRVYLSLYILLVLSSIVIFGRFIVVRIMSFLVYPFAAVLVFLSFYMMKYWNFDFLYSAQSFTEVVSDSHFYISEWLVLPLLIFSFNHSPIISSFSADYSSRFYGSAKRAGQASSRVLRSSHILMIVTVFFFLFSCLLTFSPQEFMEAKMQNVSILSYLANKMNSSFLGWLAPTIAIIAISKSFLGHYIGTYEGLSAMLGSSLIRGKFSSAKNADRFISIVTPLIIIATSWLVAVLNPSVLGLIDTLNGPIIAGLLFLLPMYLTYKLDVMKIYRRYTFSNVFVIVVGIVAISAIFYNLYHLFVH